MRSNAKTSINMTSHSLKLMKINSPIDITKLSEIPTRDITVDPRPLLTEKTDTFLPPKESALTLSENTEAIPLFATGVKELKHQQSGGSGLPERQSGIDSMMANGTTGAHQREDSPPLDGPGIKATGITVAMSTNTTEANGGDSKA